MSHLKSFVEDTIKLFSIQKEKSIQGNCALNSFYLWKKHKQHIPKLEINTGLLVILPENINKPYTVIVHIWLEDMIDNEIMIHEVSLDALNLRKNNKFAYMNFKEYCDIEKNTQYREKVLTDLIGLKAYINTLKKNYTGRFDLKTYIKKSYHKSMEQQQF